MRCKSMGILGGLLAALTWLVGQPLAQAEETQPECPIVGNEPMDVETLESGVDAVDCSLVGEDVEVVPGFSVEIPAPGHLIEVSVLSEGAPVEELTIAVDGAGNLGMLEDGSDTPVGSGQTLGACEDTSYNLLGTKMDDGEGFRINTSSFPNYMNEPNTVDAIIEGMKAWPQVDNSCGMTDDVTRGIDYLGTTTYGTTGLLYGQCNSTSGSHDTFSVIGFGDLPAGVFGATCRYGVQTSSGWQIVGGDIRLNEGKPWTNSPDATGCDSFDVESVIAHEAGHWWGFAHVSENTKLTMVKEINDLSEFRCSTWMRSLGKGDVLGMRARYN